MPNRCPCDTCTGLEDVCPLKAVRVAVEEIREAAVQLKMSCTSSGWEVSVASMRKLDGAIQGAYDAMEE